MQIYEGNQNNYTVNKLEKNTNYELEFAQFIKMKLVIGLKFKK